MKLIKRQTQSDMTDTGGSTADGSVYEAHKETDTK